MVILRPLGVGDLLTAVPALRALADAFKGHERVLAAPAALAPLAELVQAGDDRPAVHRVVPVGPLEPLPPELDGATVAVNLHGRGPESHRILLASRPGRVLWFENPDVPESRGSPRWLAGEHEVDRWCRMLAELGVPADPARLLLEVPAGHSTDEYAGCVIVHPGAASAARRWHPARFAAVARALAAQGHRVIVTGSAKEVPLAWGVANRAGLGEADVLAGRTDLSALAALVARARAVICGDTGMGHMATAFGTPSVVLFGPTPPAHWGPPIGSPQHRTLWAGRMGDPHADEPFPGLMELTVDQALRAVADVTERVPSGMSK